MYLPIGNQIVNFLTSNIHASDLGGSPQARQALISSFVSMGKSSNLSSGVMPEAK